LRKFFLWKKDAFIKREKKTCRTGKEGGKNFLKKGGKVYSFYPGSFGWEKIIIQNSIGYSPKSTILPKKFIGKKFRPKKTG